MFEAKTQKIYEFGDFRLIPGEEMLLKAGRPVALTPKAFQILLFLVEKRGHLVQKAELLDQVWGDAFVEEQAAAKTVSAVRNALQEDPKNPQFIQTIPKRGYRFVGSVREIDAAGNGVQAAATHPVNAVVPPLSGQTPLVWRPFLTIGFAVVALFVITVGFGWGIGGWFKRVGRTESIRSMTVLPLENVSGDPADEYLVDGVTDSLTADLSRLSELSFMALPAEIRRGSGLKDPKEIGTQLGVDAVLTGSVTRSGERIRITVQVIQAVSGRTLWANTYEREVRDIQALQKEIARAVAGEIRTTLSPQDLDRLRVRRAVDPQAYDQYQRGRYYLNRQNREDQDTAIAALERAVEIDPTFAIAYAELAQAYTWKHFSFSPDQTPELAEKAFIATEKALSLDPELPAAYLARGRILWTPENHFPHEKAIMNYRQALDLDPKLDEARNQLALVYCHIGALDEALRESYEGVKINPTNNLLLLRIGQSLNSQGKYAEALAVLNSIPNKVHPNVVGHQTAWALFNLGRTDEAAAKVEQLIRDHTDAGGTFASMKAVLAASAGQHRQAEEFIRDALEKGKGFGHFHHTAYTIGCAYALMNKPEEAIRYLEMAADTGYPCYPSFENEPSLNNLRQDPRFKAFMSRLKERWETIRRDAGL
jgi:TolB-like protein/DNA-binding winged helix-turn-helix (wHTH) protein/Tfp pilus assembly protein PilF